jgi:hypothetical protein
MVTFSTQPLYFMKCPPPPVPRPKNRSGSLREKNLLPPPGIEHRSLHPVASSLYCLRFPEISVLLRSDAVSLGGLWFDTRQWSRNYEHQTSGVAAPSFRRTETSNTRCESLKHDYAILSVRNFQKNSRLKLVVAVYMQTPGVGCWTHHLREVDRVILLPRVRGGPPLHLQRNYYSHLAAAVAAAGDNF